MAAPEISTVVGDGLLIASLLATVGAAVAMWDEAAFRNFKSGRMTWFLFAVGARWMMMSTALLVVLERGLLVWLVQDQFARWLSVLGMHVAMGVSCLVAVLAGAETRTDGPGVRRLLRAMGVVPSALVIGALLWEFNARGAPWLKWPVLAVAAGTIGVGLAVVGSAVARRLRSKSEGQVQAEIRARQARREQ